ncbi:nuclear transport factor 2 family protein [Arthrobacter mobilis]|uniref:Nuclear transport factor 2 family protein n=1 Tax=Arthrobacter mobilis TaxID=2724944 RepID=A0A7X6K2B5_9MICC|nr:nuclear transport factor 2 family protein [Arthrobacter mobilis]NKX53017.1 nuclear transport factor 2 family protein [Arthrobacter mobilis]
MSPRKDVVEAYIEGFRRGDHELILSCLTEDVVWVLHGYTTLTGKDAFDKEIENAAFTGKPTLTIDQLIEEGDTVVAVGSGQADRREGGTLNFVFSDVFTFTGHKISRLETFQVNLD